MPVDQIAYSQRYSDDHYEYRYVASIILSIFLKTRGHTDSSYTCTVPESNLGILKKLSVYLCMLCFCMFLLFGNRTTLCYFILPVTFSRYILIVPYDTAAGKVPNFV